MEAQKKINQSDDARISQLENFQIEIKSQLKVLESKSDQSDQIWRIEELQRVVTDNFRYCLIEHETTNKKLDFESIDIRSLIDTIRLKID